MKIFMKVLIGLISLVALLCILIFGWFRHSKPRYEGTQTLPGLKNEVSIHYDEYGVPSIQAQNKHDLYLAFGYRHAAERLFQMEMLRRAGSGRLAEIIGQPLVKVDKLFRTLGVPQYAAESAKDFESLRGQQIYEDVTAYLAGINQFLIDGPIPPEFDIIGIKPRPFTIEDMYCALGAMSFSFSQGQKSEFIIDHIHTHFGEQHLRDLGLYHNENESFIPSQSTTPALIPNEEVANKNPLDINIHAALREISNALPITSLEGSNSWVLSGTKTRNGKVLFCNDTHIGYNLPQTWYEAHLSCPNFEMYGHFLAGIPFALIGRNQKISWGLTMLLNDDVDFYKEEIDANRCKFESTWQEISIQKDTIHIKGASDTIIEVKSTSHGPIINDALKLDSDSAPISMYWTYTKSENKNLDALYELNNALDIGTFEAGLSKIHAPGLNINYGDDQGNIAWWACAHLIKRPDHVNSFLILDGTTGLDDPIGFYDFEQNPKNINPTSGFIYSANDWPQAMEVGSSDSTRLLWYPGYYKPQYRADRIVQLLNSQPKWDIESIKTVMNDHTNPMDAAVMAEWSQLLRTHKNWSIDTYNQLVEPLLTWDGEYAPQMAQPTLFAGLLYQVLHDCLSDELGEKRFHLLLETHQIQRAYGQLMFNDESVWWDVKGTPAIETRSDVIFAAYIKTISKMRDKWGDHPNTWTWSSSAQVEMKHPLGEVALFRPFYNLGPSPVFGGNESVRQAGYYLDSTFSHKVFYGSQMRIIHDFANPDSALNITPAGQSGHIMSDHYDDQFQKYLNGDFRVMRMNRQQVDGKIMKLVPTF